MAASCVGVHAGRGQRRGVPGEVVEGHDRVVLAVVEFRGRRLRRPGEDVIDDDDLRLESRSASGHGVPGGAEELVPFGSRKRQVGALSGGLHAFGIRRAQDHLHGRRVAGDPGDRDSHRVDAVLVGADRISLGDFILTGGELPALAMLEAAARFVPGVVGDPESVRCDSFAAGLLDYPVFTRPRVFEGSEVPPVLLSGNHAAIASWRLRESVRATVLRRPDLLRARWGELSAEVRRLAREVARAEGVTDPSPHE